MPTPHISASDDAFAETCLLPGDPLRATWNAETFLDDAEQVTAVRYASELVDTYGVGSNCSALRSSRFLAVPRLYLRCTTGSPTAALPRHSYLYFCRGVGDT